MGVRFRKSVKIAPGVKANISKKGISYSVGGKTAGVTVGKRGTRARTSIPGTGISYSTKIGGKKKTANSAGKKRKWVWAVAAFLLFCALLSPGNKNKDADISKASIQEPVVTESVQDATPSPVATPKPSVTPASTPTPSPSVQPIELDNTADTSVESNATKNHVVGETTDNTNISTGKDYVLNTSTMKFHYPNCKSVSKIKPGNYKEFNGTRNDLIAMRYQPCGNCKP